MERIIEIINGNRLDVGFLGHCVFGDIRRG